MVLFIYERKIQVSELILQDITKTYASKKALDSFTAELSDGVYGLLGPNGAGKTTLINIIAGILSPDPGGKIILNGKPAEKLGKSYYNSIGFMPQYPKFYPNYTAGQIMEYMTALKNVSDKSKTDELLQFVNLSDSKDKKVGAFSGGMRQRLAIAAAMVNDPEILILDEPTAGLDPIERIRFRNIISQLSANRMILIATHIVSDVEYLADRIILLNDGRIVENLTAAQLCKSIEGKVWRVSSDADSLTEYMKTHKVSEISRDLQLRVISEQKPGPDAIPAEPKLDDVFLYYLDKE